MVTHKTVATRNNNILHCFDFHDFQKKSKKKMQQAPTSTQAPTTPAAKKSMYRVPLPSHLVPFSSPEGIQLFTEALAEGGAKPFFRLIEQFSTQNDPACKYITHSYIHSSANLNYFLFNIHTFAVKFAAWVPCQWY